MVLRDLWSERGVQIEVPTPPQPPPNTPALPSEWQNLGVLEQGQRGRPPVVLSVEADVLDQFSARFQDYRHLPAPHLPAPTPA
jgi:hypothetical protein